MADKRQKVSSLHKEKTELDKVKKLEKEVARLTQENDLLKTWQRYLPERHRNDLDSSGNAGEDRASDTFVNGWEFAAKIFFLTSF